MLGEAMENIVYISDNSKSLDDSDLFPIRTAVQDSWSHTIPSIFHGRDIRIWNANIPGTGHSMLFKEYTKTLFQILVGFQT